VTEVEFIDCVRRSWFAD